jgi:hypothetical protein
MHSQEARPRTSIRAQSFRASPLGVINLSGTVSVGTTRRLYCVIVVIHYPINTMACKSRLMYNAEP